MLHHLLKYRIHIFLFIFLMCMMAFYPAYDFGVILKSFAFSCLGAFIYIFNKTTDLNEDTINVASYPIDLRRHARIKKISFALFAIGFVLTLINFKLSLLYIGLASIGYFYSVPLPLKSHSIRLKNIIGVKNISAAICWATLPVMLPILYYEREMQSDDIILWLNYFFFIMAVEIVWDIRDIDGDKVAGVKTLPNTIGVWPSKIICVIPLIILFFWRLLVISMHPIFFFAYIATIIAVLIIRKESHPFAFHALVLIWVIAYSTYLLKDVII